MHCVVYRSRRKADSYLFVEREDDFARVPAELLKMLGALELVMHLQLDLKRRLALSDPAVVRQQLAAHGYFLQMPPPVPGPRLS